MRLSAFSRKHPPREANACTHAEHIRDVTPDSPDSCLQCVEMGDTWFHLRICLECGQVGCCDNSKNKHATGHFEATGHPIIQSYEPGEAWRWCYVDQTKVTPGEPFRERKAEP